MDSKSAGDGAAPLPKRFKANPKLSEIILEEPPESKQPRKPVRANAPVDVVFYKVTDAASDVWEDCVEGVPLYQIQIEHAARSPITYQIKNNFNAFLRECEHPMPSSLDDLQAMCGIRLIVGGDDPFDVGFMQWRPAFYVVGDLKNFLLLLDGWFKHINRIVVRQKPLEVRLHPSIGIDISEVWGDLVYEHYTLNFPSAQLPLGFFEGTPIFGKEIIWVIGSLFTKIHKNILPPLSGAGWAMAAGQPRDTKSTAAPSKVSIEIEDARAVSMIISGRTYNYRERFRAMGFHSGRVPRSSTATKDQYVQFMKSIDAAAEEQKVFDVFGDKCLKNMAVKVVVDGACGQDDDSMKLIEKLRRLPNLWF